MKVHKGHYTYTMHNYEGIRHGESADVWYGLTLTEHSITSCIKIMQEYLQSDYEGQVKYESGETHDDSYLSPKWLQYLDRPDIKALLNAKGMVLCDCNTDDDFFEENEFISWGAVGVLPDGQRFDLPRLNDPVNKAIVVACQGKG